MSSIIECVRQVDHELLNRAFVASCKDLGDGIILPNCLVDRGVYPQTGADKRLISGDFPKNKPALISTMIDEGAVITGSLRVDPNKKMSDKPEILHQ